MEQNRIPARFRTEEGPMLLCLTDKNAVEAQTPYFPEGVTTIRLRGRDVFELADLAGAGVLFDPSTNPFSMDHAMVTMQAEVYLAQYGPSPEV